MAQPLVSPMREGELLGGKYRIERVLGVGGMGIVVAARHEQLGQLVAIKFVREDTFGQADAAERFLREARAAAKLKSQHVARVLDVGTLDSGAPYMVMEFLDGRDLGQVLSDDGPLAVDKAALLLLQACEAVAEAHGAGVVHRDIKPQNLFLTHTVGGSPHLKVLDFGVSKAGDLMTGGKANLTATRAMLGSPLYMSPEQMRSSRDVDARVDIWGLGVVLFELLTGRWPFEAESLPELCIKVATDPPQSLERFRPDAPEGICAAIARCLEKDPAKRFRSADELAAQLEPYARPLMSRMASRETPRSAGSERTLFSADPGTPRATLPVVPQAPGGVDATLPTAPDPRGGPSARGALLPGRSSKKVAIVVMLGLACAAAAVLGIIVTAYPKMHSVGHAAAAASLAAEVGPVVAAGHASAVSVATIAAPAPSAVAANAVPSPEHEATIAAPSSPHDAAARSNAPARPLQPEVARRVPTAWTEAKAAQRPPSLPVAPPSASARAFPSATPHAVDDDIPALR